MAQLQSISSLLNQLNMPIQDLASLSFCDSGRETSVKAWVRSLPLTQTQFVSGLLYTALPELGRLKISAEQRINLLELVRPAAMQTIEGLAQNFLNQPLILPEAAVKTATITQALQKHLVNAYLVAVRDIANDKQPKPELLGLALHRAITGLGLLLLRYYQLYLPIPNQLWLELHSLYQLALRFEVSELPVAETLHHHTHSRTITRSYLRTLMLACAKPNQLRQDEILATYQALDSLSGYVQLQDPQQLDQDNLFAVALNSDGPPMYTSRFNAKDAPLMLKINTKSLCAQLDEALKSAEPDDGVGFRNQLHLSSALTLHLMQAWNHLAQRHFEREQASGTLDVTVGLTNIHYHLAGEVSFTHFLNRVVGTSLVDDIGSIFQNRTAALPKEEAKKAEVDPWADAFDVSGTPLGKFTQSTSNIEAAIRDKEAHAVKDLHPIHSVPLIDTSPGGYCIEWRDEIPVQVKAGELLGLRDSLRNRWNLGVVRWANQSKGATQLGIQVLAPQAIPVGVAIIHKTGGFSEYLRALEIPALKAINQPATLITNAVSFREYSKARLFRRSSDTSDDQNIQLIRRLFATGAFSQFTFRTLASAKSESDSSKDDFDSVWNS